MASSTQEINGAELNKKIYYYIDYLAEYAVQVHNQQQNAHLSFIKVVKVTIEPVVGADVLYYITLEACNLGVQQLIYEAQVCVKGSTGYIELKNFQHVVGVLKDEEITKKIDLITEGINDAKISKNSTDSTVIQFAEFAVQKYNSMKQFHLVFVEVVNARIQQTFDSELYYITLEANHIYEEKKLLYDAIVWSKDLENRPSPLLELVGFKRVV
ncbi:hypothetical protein J5N97_009126 [Dioscorea zingiberensis]|uniref:Cysteine proteinase inhibitor n=1 Tax=Dioscorea zingiberensis TaxID=325984 RepID=A0A9D5CWA1_9LILI|nr:hypothetical protein J5N97_009126 [Dioscorea zingiberensis]